MSKGTKSKRRNRQTQLKLRRLKTFKILALLLLVPIITSTAFLIYYYYVYNEIIERRLENPYEFTPTEIYAAPTFLYPGKRMSFAELVAKVRRLGYQNTPEMPGVSYYQLGKENHLLVYNDASLPDDANLRVEISCSGGRIQSLVDMKSHKGIDSFFLKPELLSNVVNESREKRRFVSYREIPNVLIDAVLAAEDRRFFSHSGVDPLRIVKALIVDVIEGETVQGASTLTQQFVKNYFLTPERTWRRKCADAYISILLEKRLPKEKIFELYCNEVYLGQLDSFSIKGFGEAAEIFFDKSVKDLTLDEAATLVGIISAPNRFTPLRYEERAINRRNLVLDQMADNRMIPPSVRDQAKAKPLAVRPASVLSYSRASYFVDYIQGLLIKQFGETELARSQYKVYTSLDTELQTAAFESIQKGMIDLDDYFAKRKNPIPPGSVQTSLIAVDPQTGRILAMIGGRNYGASQFNRITQSKRQPGSIFKPFVFAAALETAYYSPTPLTVISTVFDEPTRFTFDNFEYQPSNYRDEFFGQVTMRQAITKSLNVATIKFAEKVGYSRVAELAQRLGLNKDIKPYPAIALGTYEVTPLEIARAYTAFCHGGLLTELMPVLKICDVADNPLFIAKPKTQQALTPQIAFMITSLLQSVIDKGTAAGVRARGFNLPAAAKTGTSHDGWLAGYTPDLLCIVWVGFDNNQELNLSGAQSALPIWTGFMKKAISLRPLSGKDFVIPGGIPAVIIDPISGLLATDRCLQREKEYFIRGTEPKRYCSGNDD